MNKLASFIVIALLSVSAAFAQTAPTVKHTAKKTVQPKVATAKVETKATTAKATAPVIAKKEVKKVGASVSGPVKKDGSADMRYKANKTAKVAGPTKKDGTADMRYKANKAKN